LSYGLWPFQKRILEEMGESTLILGLPTGLGKTYLAGAKLHEESLNKAIRVLFLVPSVPLGVQQTLFAREKLGVEAFFVSGALSPETRKSLKVWNNSFVVATPQTFYNDILAHDLQEGFLREARTREDPVEYLRGLVGDFPFDVVVADECQRYIGETDGYSILLAAKASGTNILALSATPQLHNPERLRELEKVFKEIRTFSVEDPGIKGRMPERLLVLEQVNPPSGLLKVYRSLGRLIGAYAFRIRKKYGPGHPRHCDRHPLCRALLAVRMLRMRMMEDGASSVKDYRTWRFRDLKSKRKELEGKSIHRAYLEAMDEHRNHKLDASETILQREIYKKAIVYIESVEGAKELAARLGERYGMADVACLVGKGDMSMDEQASALLQFREEAGILVCTSVGEEGLDIPTADLEVWVDPPANPRKWIQRFGRVLRQPGEKKMARVYAIVTKGTHEKGRLLSVKKQVEGSYGFTQRLEVNNLKTLTQGQRRLSEYLKES
jgi:superfamily II DNA or RNA helicase